jgi:hypothetical protein
MKHFTGYEYTMIDIANHMGLDKETFEVRIKWVEDNMADLESLVPKAHNPILFAKGVFALRDAQNGIPTGHMIGLDACASGPQIMGAIVGCERTCAATGLIHPDIRSDLYSDVVGAMNKHLIAEHQLTLGTSVSRDDVKEATVPFFYGSTAAPKRVFVDNSPAYVAYFNAMADVAPGAVNLISELQMAWQPFALAHEWTLPDGYKAHVKVMEAVDIKIEIDELDHATFTHRFYENAGAETGLSLAANVVHSIDGMIVREMNRRCNYEREKLQRVLHIIDKHTYLEQQLGAKILSRSKFISLGMVEAITPSTVGNFETLDLLRLAEIIERTLLRKSFPVICVHDEFKCAPNNMNILRQTYIDIMAELAESCILADILAEITGTPHKQKKPNNPTLGSKIRKSNYGLS